MWKIKVRHCDTILKTLPVVLHYIILYILGQKGMFSQAKQSISAVFAATVRDKPKYLWSGNTVVKRRAASIEKRANSLRAILQKTERG